MANFFVDYIFKNSVFYMILTALLCLLLNIGINLAFSYLYIFLLDKFLESLYYLKYILIPVLFIYNYLILRKIVITWLYEWQFPFQIFSIYRERQTYVSFLKERVTYFSNAIDVLLAMLYDIDTIKKIWNKQNYPGFGLHLGYGLLSILICWIIYIVIMCLLTNRGKNYGSQILKGYNI